MADIEIRRSRYQFNAKGIDTNVGIPLKNGDLDDNDNVINK